MTADELASSHPQAPVRAGWTNDLEVRFDFLPEPLRQALVTDIDVSNARMRQFSLADSASTPPCVSDAARYASEQLSRRFNCAILKIYRRSDTYESGAYEAHHDPPSVRTAPLVLCTLTGEADLTFWSPAGAESRVRCIENMAVLVNPTLLHRVSPPLGPDGERRLLYLFLDTAVDG